MLLDDAEDPGQVRALMLASPGCLTLVTARPALPELVLDGARLRQLRPWPPHTGRVLLRRVLGAKRVADEPEAALRLSELCGGLPLAIGLSAARLMADPHASISTAAADLTDCAPPRREPTTDQNPEIAMALALTYRALTEPQARLLRALAACPINIVDAPTAAAVLPCDLQQAERLLTDLVTLCLLDRPADHYVLRPLVRAYAQRRDLQLDAREPDQVRDRLTDYLVATATAAQALLTPSHHLFPYTTRFDPPPPAFTDNDGARDWISAHHHDLMGLLRHRVRERDHDAVWRLAWALWPAFHLLHLDGRLEAQRSALAAAQAAAERAAEANLLTSLAGTLMHAGELSDGAEHNRRALALHQQLGNLRGQGQAANGLAKTLLESGDLDGADAYFGRALDLRTETGYQRGVCLSRHGQGRVALARGDLRRAIELFDDAYRGLTAEGDQYDAAWSLACGAQARAGLGENDLALRHLAAALDQMRAAGSRHGQIGVLEITARVHQARGDTDGARTSFHAALDLAGYDHAARRRLQEALDALQ
jgi:tetratricopeptide (TPR) repeat protein